MAGTVRVWLATKGDAMAFRAIVERHHRGMHAVAPAPREEAESGSEGGPPDSEAATTGPMSSRSPGLCPPTPHAPALHWVMMNVTAWPQGCLPAGATPTAPGATSPRAWGRASRELLPRRRRVRGGARLGRRGLLLRSVDPPLRLLRGVCQRAKPPDLRPELRRQRHDAPGTTRL